MWGLSAEGQSGRAWGGPRACCRGERSRPYWQGGTLGPSVGQVDTHRGRDIQPLGRVKGSWQRAGRVSGHGRAVREVGTREGIQWWAWVGLAGALAVVAERKGRGTSPRQPPPCAGPPPTDVVPPAWAPFTPTAGLLPAFSPLPGLPFTPPPPAAWARALGSLSTDSWHQSLCCSVGLCPCP